MEGVGNTTWPNKYVYRENMKANNIARQTEEPNPTVDTKKTLTGQS